MPSLKVFSLYKQWVPVDNYSATCV